LLLLLFSCALAATNQQLVVLLVSDIGATAIRSEILPYARREDVPPRVLMGAVKHALDRQWANLRFGKVRYSSCRCVVTAVLLPPEELQRCEQHW
jgi:hypothetical protein